MRLLATATRLKRLGLALPSVTSNLVLAKPSAFNFCSIRCARRRLKANSGTLRALVAPSDSAVCPTSNTSRNFERLQIEPSGFGLAGPKVAGFEVWGFRETACLAEAAGFREATCCLDDLPSFEDPLRISDSQPAALASIGRSINAAITAMTVRRRYQTSKRERAILTWRQQSVLSRVILPNLKIQPYRALILSNMASACSNLTLKSHIASRISRKLADVLALSACP